MACIHGSEKGFAFTLASAPTPCRISNLQRGAEMTKSMPPSFPQKPITMSLFHQRVLFTANFLKIGHLFKSQEPNVGFVSIPHLSPCEPAQSPACGWAIPARRPGCAEQPGRATFFSGARWLVRWLSAPGSHGSHRVDWPKKVTKL